MKHLVLAALIAAAPAPSAPAVAIKDFAFAPATVTVIAGQTVRFVNRDEEAHTVTAKDGSFDSGGLDTGASWTHRFDRPGRYAYFCSLHPYMTGTIVVIAARGRAQ
jgi:plastocyanin